MNNLVATEAGITEPVPASLSDELVWLCKFGKPRLMMMSDGWMFAIDMNTNTTGTAFKVSSDYDFVRPEQAVEQGISRMLEALATLAGSKT